ncbi:protein kinase [Streptomyces sp. MBT33]|uniref:protein kinase n=1 Tax=Streptomyces sp. MBT33 TaxID=1488363 RepID=UPI001909D61A|nr:protein kinase [Streptomyces sp. MBT33]MBK3644007.1 protein kinase [Streptomyces sp. MBT33]
MDDYAGRVLADRYRLPLPPSDEYELTETRAFDTYSGQEVLVRQVPLPEVVEAEVLDAEGLPDGFQARRPTARTGTRGPADPAVRRAVEAAQAAARIPDHPRLDQVFDVFADGGSLWIVSELVAARPLAALLAEKPLTPYRAAEVASDVLMALRVLHAHGWVHRNITARTVLVCDDGRVMLTGLVVGAAEEALCGYDPVPAPDGDTGAGGPGGLGDGGNPGGHGGSYGPGAPGARGGPGGSSAPGGPRADGGRGGPQGGHGGPGGHRPVDGGGGGVGGLAASGGHAGSGVHGGLNAQGGTGGVDPVAARSAAIRARTAGGLPGAEPDTAGGSGGTGALAPKALETGGDIRAARAGAIAAYRAGARAAARVQEAQNGRAALPGARPAPEEDPAARTNGSGQPYRTGEEQVHPNGTAQPYATGEGGPGSPVPPGQIADPYGVGGGSWHGATPRGGADGGGSHALPHGGDSGQGGAGSQGAGPGIPPHLGTAPPAGLPNAPGFGASHATDVPAPRAAGPVGGGSDAARSGPGPAASGTPAVPQPTARWGDLVAGTPAPPRGPATALAAERARQARMAVVGPVTERWAPEQAGPVHENWQLAAPIGPATDLWALGALLFRAVQGHAPYPEESTAELVQMVCAEPPAFAEECGPLRPVVESLLRQDPTERLDFEELRGWLRSLVRSAPEPDAGTHVVPAPPADASRLPVIRRRGELVRRRRAGVPATTHGRHKRAKEQAGSPRRLGRTLLVLILLLLAGAIAYAMLFMPKAGEDGAAGSVRTGATGNASPAPERSDQGGSRPSPEQTSPTPKPSPSRSSGSTEPQTTDPAVADGFTLRKDPEGFRVAVAEGWSRTGRNAWNQVVYSKGTFQLIVVPGRDGAVTYGSDPMAYQRDKEHELQPYRSSSWATATGLRTITVGTRVMAEGQFTWTDGSGQDLYVRNLAILIDGRYHVVQVRGPESQRDQVTKLYEQAYSTYTYTG